MNKIQVLAKEIKQIFSPQIITDVYSICKQLGIDIVEAPIKADAYLKCEDGSSYIVLKESLNVNRKKFTIAHELGHFYIPWHSELMFGCDIKEMDFKNDYVPREKEANMFAAELLMPIEEFKNFFSGKINYTMVSGLANIFDVSFQAAPDSSLTFFLLINSGKSSVDLNHLTHLLMLQIAIQSSFAKSIHLFSAA